MPDSSPFPLPDLTGRTTLVTGASSGVGREIAHALAAAGATVLMPVRNPEKGARAAEAIVRRTPGARLDLMDLDLASLDSARALAARLRDERERIDLAVLNAGVVMIGDRDRHITADGHELHHQTNFLGHAALVLGMLPLLRGGRVVAQLSIAARMGRLRADDPGLRRGYGAMRAYAGSKAALGAFTVELARRSAAGGLDVAAHLCHPGVAPDTGIAATIRRDRGDGATAAIVRRLSNTPAEAAQPALAAAVTTLPAPSFHVPRGPWQIAGAPAPARLFRTVASRAHGAIAWRWAQEALVRTARSTGADAP